MNLKWQHNAARNFLRSSVVTWLWRKCAHSQKCIFATPSKDRNYRCSSNHFQLWRYQTAMGCPHEPLAVPSCALSIPGGIRLAQDLPIPPSLSPCPAQSLLALALPPLGLGHIQPGRLNLSLQTSLAGWEREKGPFPATFWWLAVQGCFYTFQFLPQLLQRSCTGLSLRCESMAMSLQNSCFSSDSCILPVLRWVTLQSDSEPALPL